MSLRPHVPHSIKRLFTLEMSSVKKHFLILLLLIMSSFLFSAVIFTFFEGANNHIGNFEDFLWWWIVTTSTVGYGDIVPVTVWGRVVGVYCIIIGVYTYTDVVSLILSNVHNKITAKEKGKAPIDARKHVLICDYTAFADEMIQEIKHKNLFPDKQIVLLTALVERNPYPEYDFVYGVPISPQSLLRAHVDKASHIFVFSNNRFTDPDSKSLHVVSRILRLTNTAEVYVELQDPNMPLLKELNGTVKVLKSDDLLHSSIAHKYLQLERYLN